MIINHNCCIKLVPLVIFIYVWCTVTHTSKKVSVQILMGSHVLIISWVQCHHITFFTITTQPLYYPKIKYRLRLYSIRVLHSRGPEFKFYLRSRLSQLILAVISSAPSPIQISGKLFKMGHDGSWVNFNSLFINNCIIRATRSQFCELW